MAGMNFVLPDPDDIKPEDVPAAVTRLCTLASALTAKLMDQRYRSGDGSQEDVLLTAREAAKLLSFKPSWLYRNAQRLPFTKRISRRGLRFSKRGLIAWRDRKGSSARNG